MMPDKIYLRCGRHDSERMDMFWYDEACYPDKPEVEQEYIRKDALLEWANSWLAFKRSGIVLDDGFSYAMEELIKKLNYM